MFSLVEVSYHQRLLSLGWRANQSLLSSEQLGRAHVVNISGAGLCIPRKPLPSGISRDYVWITALWEIVNLFQFPMCWCKRRQGTDLWLQCPQQLAEQACSKLVERMNKPLISPHSTHIAVRQRTIEVRGQNTFKKKIISSDSEWRDTEKGYLQNKQRF